MTDSPTPQAAAPALAAASAAPRAFVFDLDGVLYRGEDAVDGAADCIARLRARTDPPAALFFLTNNSTQTRRFYADKLTRLGMPVTEDEIVTSASATAAHLAETPGAPGKTVLAVGGPGIADELARVGMKVVRADALDPTGPEIAEVHFVVVGLDRALTYHTLYCAQQAILQGAAFVATNRDGQYPIEGGRVTPGGGAMVAALEACTEVTPTVIGKPETLGLQTILHRTGARPDEAVMIGDRLDTDVLCGNRLGVPTVLVLTGVTGREAAERAAPEMRPGRIIPTLREL